MAKNKITFFNYLNVFVRWKKFIVRNTIIVGLISLILSFVLPKWYMSSATLMPPKSESNLLGLSAVLSDLPDIGGLGGLGGGGTSADIYIAILHSRTLLDSMIYKFDLKNVYDQELMKLTRDELLEHLGVNLNDNGTISVSAEASTPYFSFGERDKPAIILSKDLVEYALHVLDKINKRLRSESAKNNRLFIEKRYLQNINDLSNAEEAMKRFQESNKAISLTDQIRATIETMAAIKSEALSKEIEIEVLEKIMSPSNSMLIQRRKEHETLQEKLNQLSDGSNSTTDQEDVLLPFSSLPKLGLEYAQIYRELLIQQKLQEFLLPQYEQAKIQEAKDTPTIQILDPPLLPEWKSRPKRALIILGMIFISFVFTFIAGYIVANLEYLKQTDTEKYSALTAAFDAVRIKNLFK